MRRGGDGHKNEMIWTRACNSLYLESKTRDPLQCSGARGNQTRLGCVDWIREGSVHECEKA